MRTTSSRGVARFLRSHQGFTLIELLVVVLIIGILIAVSAPSFLGQTQKAHDSVAKQYLSVAYESARADAVDNPLGQGLYRTPSQLVSAISTGEPELTVAVGACPQAADSTPSHVFVDPSSSATKLILCDDPDHTVWTLTATNTGPPIFSSQVVALGDSGDSGSGGDSAPADYDLTTTVAGQGSLSSEPAGIDCGSTCQASFAAGTSVTLTPTPATGYTFSGWSGDCSGSGACTISLSQSRAVTATFASSYAQAVEADSPSAFWRLGEPSGTTATAAVGGLDGSYHGTPVSQYNTCCSYGATTDGAAAANFNGNGNGGYVEVANSAAFNPSGSFTVEAWAYPTNNGSAARAIVSSRDVVNGSGYMLYGGNNNTTVCGQVFNASVGVSSCAGGGLPLLTWSLVAMVYDASAHTLTIYDNGNAVASSGGTYYAPNSSTPLRIAAHSDASIGEWFIGAIGDVAVYPQALSGTQLLAHYSER